MDADERRVRKREQRRERVRKARQNSLIVEYVRNKYSNIYKEGVEFYNSINKENIEKHDLRKTIEFQYWETNTLKEQQSNPKTPSTSEPTTTSTTPTNTLKEQHSNPKTPSTSEPTTTSTTPRKQICENNFELQNPLMQLPTTAGEDTSNQTDQTLYDIQKEILGEGTIYPSLEEEKELIEKIIELRTDPDLNNIFADIEEQIEFQQLGDDMDILQDRSNELVYW